MRNLRSVLGAVLLACSQGSVAQSEPPTLVISAIREAGVIEPTTRVLREAYQALGIEIRIVHYPATRALVEANAGNVDGELERTAGLSAEFPNLIQVPVPIGYFRGVGFVTDDSISSLSWEGLGAFDTVYVRGVKFSERHLADTSARAVTDMNQIFHLLVRGRVDVGVAAYLTGMKIILENDFQDIRPVFPALDQFALYHYLHRDHQALLPRVSDVLADMQESGRIDEIWRDYRIGTVERLARRYFLIRRAFHGGNWHAGAPVNRFRPMHRTSRPAGLSPVRSAHRR